jgi:hypothetical protein
MKRTITLAALLSVVALTGMAQAPKPAGPKMTVYKSATCGCCSMWVEHMKKAGFTTTVMDVDDIEVPMKTYGVPAAAASCHTAIVNGYVVDTTSSASISSVRSRCTKSASAGSSLRTSRFGKTKGPALN